MLNIFNDPIKDARSILESVDYRIIKAAWELYAAEDQKILQLIPSTPDWRMLSLILESNGNIERLGAHNLPLLKSFNSVVSVYGEIVKMLEEKSHNSELAEEFFKRFPDLHDAIPAAYSNHERMYDVMIDALIQYRKNIDGYAKKHAKWLREIGYALEAKSG
jgi:hypothetical protein